MYKSTTVFESISVRDIECGDGSLSALYTVKGLNGKEKFFKIHYSYKPLVERKYILPFAGLIVSTPLINYALFAERILFDIPILKQKKNLLGK